MSLYRRGSTWWIRFTTPNGKRVRKSARTSDRKAAQEMHDRLRAEYWRVVQLGDKPRRSWQEAVVRWTDEKGGKADAKHDLQKARWLHGYLGELYLDEISGEVVRRIARDKRKATSPATANRYLALIRSILRAARDDWEWIDKIPRVRLFSEPAKRVRWISKEEAQRLVAELPEHLADMAAFSLCTGLRRSNVTGLQWSDVDTRRQLAWIHPDQSKSSKAIAVPLNDDALAILSKWRGRHKVWVFVYQGRPVFQTSTKAWYAALERAGIKNFRWHDLRHTWASWHVQSGTTLQELLELGGWSSYQMVLRYAHLESGQLTLAARRIDGFMIEDHGANKRK